MNVELTHRLANEYEDLFYWFHEDADDHDGLVPPLTVYGIQCDDGWYDLLDALCKTIEEHDDDLVIHQIKEKFGGLRFYHDGTDSKEVWGAIRLAENMSRSVCEECGTPGKLRNEGWMRVRCGDCYTPIGEKSERV